MNETIEVDASFSPPAWQSDGRCRPSLDLERRAASLLQDASSLTADPARRWWICSLDVFRRLCPSPLEPTLLGLPLVASPFLPDNSLALEHGEMGTWFG